VDHVPGHFDEIAPERGDFRARVTRARRRLFAHAQSAFAARGAEKRDEARTRVGARLVTA